MKSPSSILQGVVDSSNTAKSTIRSLKSDVDSLQLLIEQSESELARLNDPKVSEDAFDDSLKLALSLANDITKQEIQISLSKVHEYNNLAFAAPLLSVADAEELYEIVPRGNGWSRNISVNIDFDSVAGTLDDYAESVEYARDALKVKDGRDPVKASIFWAEKVWGTPLYQKTIKKRFEGMTSTAPYWSLINYGNVGKTMNSDIGGSPYPRSARGHRFKEHAEQRIYRAFREDFVKKRVESKQSRDALSETIKSAKLAMKDAQKSLNTMINSLDNPTVVKAISREIGKKISPRDADRVRKALIKFIEGNDYSGRVSLQGKRYSVSKIAGFDY